MRPISISPWQYCDSSIEEIVMTSQQALSNAIAPVVAHVRDLKNHSAWTGPGWPSADEQVRRVRSIEQWADAMERLTAYAHFELALFELHKLGMFPFNDDVSRVAQTAVQLEAA
jgi:hypothetical protein